MIFRPVTLNHLVAFDKIECWIFRRVCFFLRYLVDCPEQSLAAIDRATTRNVQRSDDANERARM